MVYIRTILSLVLLSLLFVSCDSTPKQTSDSISEQTYNLKIEAGTGGTIPAGQADIINGKYKEGAEIRIIARENPGYYFVNWTSSNGGTFTDEKNSTATFKMPGNDTVLTAHFAQITNMKEG
jgi:uncharacterized repeat protein (TIGR02543 family)